MDLPKACDCLPHDLLLAKLEAHGFNKGRVKLLLSYLTNHMQRITIGSTLTLLTPCIFKIALKQKLTF